MCCTKSAAHEAKNRLGMPDELPPTFEAIARYLPPVQFQGKRPAAAAVEPVKPAKGNISGIVRDGSSKSNVVVGVESPF
jgi:hypothetical protein